MQIKTTEVKTENGTEKTIELDPNGWELFKFMLIAMAVLWSVPFIIHWGWLAAERFK